jgi:hypothetical protein
MTTFLLCTETTLTRPQRLLPLIVFPCISQMQDVRDTGYCRILASTANEDRAVSCCAKWLRDGLGLAGAALGR